MSVCSPVDILPTVYANTAEVGVITLPSLVYSSVVGTAFLVTQIWPLLAASCPKLTIAPLSSTTLSKRRKPPNAIPNWLSLINCSSDATEPLIWLKPASILLQLALMD